MPLVPKVIFVMEDGPGRPSQGLPPGFGGPVDPGYGVEAPVDPGYGVPGYGGGHPSHPIARPPGGMPRPDNSLPPPPQVGVPIEPTQPIPPGQELPPLPKGSLILVWAPGKGWVAIPISPPSPDQGLPEQPARPDQGLPPSAQPKRF